MCYFQVLFCFVFLVVNMCYFYGILFFGCIYMFFDGVVDMGLMHFVIMRIAV